jgi:hypothetical protein
LTGGTWHPEERVGGAWLDVPAQGEFCGIVGHPEQPDAVVQARLDNFFRRIA